MSQKIMVNKEIESFSTSTLDGSIGSIISWLKDIENHAHIRGYTDVTLEVGQVDENQTVSVKGDIIETDKEFEARLRRENKTNIAEQLKKAKLEAKEKRELTRLLRKYPNQVPPVR